MSFFGLNYQQECELARLLDYEYATCSAKGELLNHCAFPFRPHDMLQMELIGRGALATRMNEQGQTVVVITSAGYSYFPERQREEAQRRAQRSHEVHLVVFSALFGVLCVVLGFLLGHYVA